MNPHNPTPGTLDHGLEAEYEILDELGRGGVSVVYLARDRMLGRTVAIKVIRDAHLEDDEALSRFEREARVLASLQHPNIVTLYAARRLQAGSLALVMQHGDWRTLKNALREDGPFSPDLIEGVLRDVGSALIYLHRNGMVHRDVKPENIFLERDTGRALLSDFGIAKHRDGQASVTLTGVVIGTPAYMSPEQIDGTELDGRSDLYALGMVGYEMITGRRPWEGESLYGVIFKQKNERLPSPRSLRTDLPEALSAAIEKAVEKRPEDRWATVEDFLAGLATAVPVTRPAAAAPGAAPAATAPPSPLSHEAAMVQVHRVVAEAALSAPPPPAPARPRRLALIAVAVCIIGSGAAALALASNRDAPVSAPPPETSLASASTSGSLASAGALPADPAGGEDAPLAGPSSPPPAPAAAASRATASADAPATRERTPDGSRAVLGAPAGSPGAAARRGEPPVLGEASVPEPALRVVAPSDAAPQASPEAVVLRTFAPTSPAAGVMPELRNRAYIGRLLNEFHPAELRDRGIGGTVVISLLVAENGSIVSTGIARSSGHAALDSAAIQLGRLMEFTATGDYSVPRRVWVNIPLTFEGRPRDQM